MLKFFELEARFPRHAGEIPPVAVDYVSSVKGEPDTLKDYRFSGRAFEYHRGQIRHAFGFREATVSDEAALSAWLADELARSRAEKIESPAASRIGRVVESAKVPAEQKFCARTVARPPEGAVTRLEELVAEEGTADGSRTLGSFDVAPVTPTGKREVPC